MLFDHGNALVVENDVVFIKINSEFRYAAIEEIRTSTVLVTDLDSKTQHEVPHRVINVGVLRSPQNPEGVIYKKG